MNLSFEAANRNSYEELAQFTGHYTNRGNTIYFRFGPSPVYNRQILQELKPIILTIGNSAPLVYDETQDETRKPVITIQLLKVTRSTAAVRIGLPIEGVVGNFTLEKKSTWSILNSEVYEM
ncbi:hypothetical protein [Hymenobacter sediminis]|uniref:hypothetical protein n=1 Tax=Hymenobacter sediminis TaxID=2218621 RepID=UPI001EE4DE98|nr:hypothetical protein [Hymenobacter sediminis]